MKRFKKWLLLTMCAGCMLTFAIACKDTQPHQHKYKEDWSYDTASHWHAAACQTDVTCTTAKESLATHTDTDNNKICDVCSYDYGHVHEWEAEWSSDESGHRYAVSCGCSIQAKDEAAHIDENNDGACDVCAYDDGHEHTYMTDAWATDEVSHWHAPTCTHSVKADEEAHTFDDMDRCSVCGYVKGDIDVEKAVLMGQYYQALVNRGEVVYQWTNGTSNTLHTVYTLGQKYTVLHHTRPSDGTEEILYYNAIPNGVFAVRESVDETGAMEAVPLAGVPTAMLQGYVFDGLFGTDGLDSDTFYGVADLITGLYDRAKDAGMECCVTATEGKTRYAFSFVAEFHVSDTTDEVHRYSVEVAFTLGAQYNYEDITIASASQNAEGSASFEYMIVQTTGDRPNEQKYVPEELLMTDFEIYLPDRNADGSIRYDLDGKVVFKTEPVTDATIWAYPGEYFPILLQPTAPDQVVYDMDVITINGEPAGKVIYIDALNARPGISNCVIATLLCEKTYVLEVLPTRVTALHPLIKDGMITISQNYYTVMVGEEGSKTLIVSATANVGADGAYEATVDHGTLKWNFDGTYTLQDAVPGRYVITFVSKVNPVITAKLTITIEEPPLVGSKFCVKNDRYVTYLTFGTDGILFLDNDDGKNGVFIGHQNHKYAYAYDEKTQTVTVHGAKLIIARTKEDDGWTLFWENEMTGEPYRMIYVTKVGAVGGVPDSDDKTLGGEYQILGGSVLLTFEEGVLTIVDHYHLGAENLSGNYTYQISNNQSALAIFDADGAKVEHFWIYANRNGDYLFQSYSLRLPEELIRQEEEAPENPILVGSFWTQNKEIILTFYQGTLTVVDNFNFKPEDWNGEYSYTINENQGIEVTTLGGEPVSGFWFVRTASGQYQFQGLGILLPQDLIPVSGNGDSSGSSDDGLEKGIYSCADPDDPRLEGVYVIDFEMKNMTFMREGWYPSFSGFTVEDDVLTFTWTNANMAERLKSVTFVYHPDNDTITMTMNEKSFVLKRIYL